MNVLLIGTAYPHRGGIAHFNALLFRTLQRRGHQVSMISFTRQYPSLFFPGKTQLDRGRAGIRVSARPMLDSVNPFSWVRVAAAVRQQRPDVVIFKYWMPFFAPAYATIAWLAKQGRNTRVLYICDNIIPHERRPGDRLLTHVALKTVDFFIVMSESVKRDLLQIKPDAVYRRVEHPVYEIFGAPVPREKARAGLGLSPDEPVVLFFGYIRRYKGLHLLLSALPRVLQQRRVRLLVAGEFYDDPEPYLASIRELGIEEQVTLATEFIPNEKVGVYFGAADVVALPYVSATQSGVVQIAYHFDRPVVATPVGGLPEVIESGKTGVVAEDVTPEGFARALLRFFELQQQVDFPSHIRTFKQRFSWDRMAEAIESLVAGT